MQVTHEINDHVPEKIPTFYELLGVQHFYARYGGREHPMAIDDEDGILVFVKDRGRVIRGNPKESAMEFLKDRSPRLPRPGESITITFN